MSADQPDAILEIQRSRRDAVTSVMRMIHDALEIEGDDMDLWCDQGYAVAEFQREGWIMRVQITSRRQK